MKTEFKKVTENWYSLLVDDMPVGGAHLTDRKTGIVQDKIPKTKKWQAKKNITIYAFSIIHQYQGKGYSKILLQGIIDECKKQDIDLLTLGVFSNNTIAFNLYKKFGFKSWKKQGIAVYMYLNI